MGDPVAWAWRDAESFADLFSAWYTDHEPGSALVVERDGQVVGYLLGCRDSRAVAPPAAALRRHVLRRGLLVRPGTAPVLWRAAADLTVAAARRTLASPPGPDDRWPAHLHIDLLPSARGTGAGRTLIERWLALLRRDAVPGCHLETWAENDGAIAFFEAMGFARHGAPRPMPGVRSPEGHRHHTQLMVQTLAPGGPTP
jgi:ribosomal protein S18 acetylase RimI-like enzyme